ncbi:tRNA uridine-5-carboxymethylaminomethyl(34) synthesis enzyme MnmG [Porphyromonas sp. oral taxon 275]|uniref:tRNA uridine-5-carboxymethylaminomethyl(34) synthesis enzyme MnmG n=1 Tax=Porphyromonas sp. oral taxon 275 TaxID=712435 RepID=UPI001BA481C3|nr:tRNA uridine-5-carboxymethylaminomethyl(34) synthesis enzyme MnmG [Porphyromonas sp. oral taxon 275]QUB43860.1 tRNA uridine-5-carboxymethylaminomethyl(34) synthesis enzyme MnmG [Porphyromonas sp. oral taxon 275]
MMQRYDIIVIGAGHAGCEAAAAAARLGSHTLLITPDMNKIGQMSCNPAVGGIAKGQIVREIDALGGRMGLVTDRTAIQFRTLNRSKGPAMWSPRAQSDRMRFMEAWRQELDSEPLLDIWQDTVTSLDLRAGRVHGVFTGLGVHFESEAVILTAGTFLSGLMHFGELQIAGGRISEPASYGITEQLRAAGLRSDRMKTGTPPRIDARSLHLEELTIQEGELDHHKFSFMDTPARSSLKQRPCYGLFTNEACHRVLREALDRSPLYNGQIQSIGPRYCPSIETKIVTFADKDRHQLFLEPEGEDTNEYYINGFSSSLPLEVQLEALRQIPELRDVRLYRPGYAIEYDFFDPTQLHHTLESKVVSHLYLAGQVNGTTGYEEAAGQGLIAGINAHQQVHELAPFTLSRSEAYIGVLIDDLVTKGVDEPYRMFTSRAEYRILLRQDDADMRLTPRAAALGLATPERVALLEEKIRERDALIAFIEGYSIRPDKINPQLEAAGLATLRQGCKLIDLVLRPQLSILQLAQWVPALERQLARIPSRREELIECAEILIKYSGYIERERQQAEKLERLEHVFIPETLDYSSIQALSTEARQKLERIRPTTIGQASRIPGISPHDVSVLLVLAGR